MTAQAPGSEFACKQVGQSENRNYVNVKLFKSSFAKSCDRLISDVSVLERVDILLPAEMRNITSYPTSFSHAALFVVFLFLLRFS